jgi:hypothetical protein
VWFDVMALLLAPWLLRRFARTDDLRPAAQS